MKFLQRSLVAALLLLGVPAAARAVEHQVFGQVLQIAAKAAADESISQDALHGSPRPFVRVRVFDADTLEPLGEVDSDVDGLFSVTFDKPEAYSPRISCRVLQIFQSPAEAQVLPPAREGINTFSGVPRYFLTFLKVLADDTLDYGDLSASAGVGGTPGIGLVFTRVGKTETQFIRQNTTATGGLADFTADPGRAAELGVPAFRDAPFGGQLFLFGEFGPCPTPPARIDYYRVKIRRVDPAPGPWRFWNQPLRKTRTLVTTAPALGILHQLVPVGPFSGTASGGSAVDNLYWVNRNEVGGATSTFFSFPDLRVQWATSGWPEGDGLYEIGLEYYAYDSGDVDHPVVHQLSGCFVSPAAPVGQLYLRVNNQPLDVHLDALFLKSAAGLYFAGRDSSGAPLNVAGTAGALNFATTGLCEIMELEGIYDVEARFTARHLGNYMGGYQLTATPNAGSPPVVFAAVHYPDATGAAPVFPPGASPPFWPGTPGAVALVAHGQFVRCAYIFDLSASSRVQDGDQYIQSFAERKAWYIKP